MLTSSIKKNDTEKVRFESKSKEHKFVGQCHSHKNLCKREQITAMFEEEQEAIVGEVGRVREVWDGKSWR